MRRRATMGSFLGSKFTKKMPQGCLEAQQQPAAPPTSIGGALGGALGGRFGLGKKKPAADQPGAGAKAPGGGGQRGARGGAWGGGLGRGKKKPAADQPAPASNAPAGGGQASGAPGSLLEMTTELSSFSAGPADASLFEVPPGFKKVDTDLKRMK